MADWIWKGVRIAIDEELDACVEREELASEEVLAAHANTRDVLERKRAEIIKGEKSDA